VGSPLARFVEAIWTAESASGPFPGPQIVVPDGTVNWIFNLGDPYTLHSDEGTLRCGSGSVIIGARSRSCLMDMSGRLGLLGIRFRPGGLHAFAAHDASELTDRFVPPEAVFGASARSLEARIFEARLPAHRVRLIERTLTGLKRGPDMDPPIQHAVDELLRVRGTRHIAVLAEERALGYKRLERGFQRLIGLTPKRFARTIRLLFVSHEALHQQAPWAAIATNCGFWDQAHLIGDMKKILGATPGDLTSGRSVVASILSSPERLSNFSKSPPDHPL
jgi:AraC-like DNA-binding protein